MKISKKYFFLLFILIFINSHILAWNKHPLDTEREIIIKMSTLFQEKKYSQAFLVWNKYKDKYRFSVNFYYWGGRIYLFLPAKSLNTRNYNYAKGIQLLLKSIKYLKFTYYAHPENKKKYLLSLFYLGMAYYSIGNMKMCISYMKRLLTIDIRYAPAWYNISVAYEHMHNTVEANRAFIKYIQSIQTDEDNYD